MNTTNNNTDVVNLYQHKLQKINININYTKSDKDVIITNINEIINILNCPILYLLKYFVYELHTQSIFNRKKNLFTIKNVNDVNKLYKILYNFILNYIRCSKCKRLKTVLHTADDTNTVTKCCKLCNHYTILKNQHKLDKFILKNLSNITNTTLKIKKKLNNSINYDNNYVNKQCATDISNKMESVHINDS